MHPDAEQISAGHQEPAIKPPKPGRKSRYSLKNITSTARFAPPAAGAQYPHHSLCWCRHGAKSATKISNLVVTRARTSAPAGVLA
jgi:hypothetical protein